MRVTDSVPVTLLTGFLGAGKTTLLNHVLRTATDRRFAIIENEFGELGIDGSLVATPVEALFELSQGCVCCTVRDDLVDVLVQLLNRPNLDHVILETTGLAEPAPVLQVFQTPNVRDGFHLNGLITVVDAAQVEQDLAETSTCAEQISYADLLVLNKTDQVPSERWPELEARLHRLNPLARIVRAQHGQVPVDELLALQRHDASHLGQTSVPHTHHHHHHDDTIGSVALEADGDIDIGALDRWLGDLTRRSDIDVLRMKGVVAVVGQSRRFVFHGVRRSIDVRPDRPWGDEVRRNRLVLIGRGLDAEMLGKGFRACLRDAFAPSVSGGLRG
ncbi:MAG: GTP-binding protein [Myxococcota bacterium]